jgi:hypothetical protein
VVSDQVFRRRVSRFVRGPLWTLVSVVALGVAVLELGPLAWLATDEFGGAEFDARLWAPLPRSGEEDPCRRGRMVRELQRRVLLPGISSAEVERVLGEPDQGVRALVEYRYALGGCTGRPAWAGSLRIHFAEDGSY